MINQIEHHFILFSITFLLIGFIIGRIIRFNIVYEHNNDEEYSSKTKKRNASNKKNKESVDKPQKIPTISIDESTHVVSIKTNDLEKKYDSIGDNKSTNENINSSINKLKNLRGEK